MTPERKAELRSLVERCELMHPCFLAEALDALDALEHRAESWRILAHASAPAFLVAAEHIVAAESDLALERARVEALRKVAAENVCDACGLGYEDIHGRGCPLHPEWRPAG